MLCYFISKKDFSLLNCVEVNSYTITQNIDCGGKSKIIIAGNPNASSEDFVILKDNKKTIFKGIVEKIDNVYGERKHTVSCLEIEQIFSRKIFLSDTDMIKTTGIEDFVIAMIRKNFSQSGDAFIDMSYMKLSALTHTPVASKPDADNGIYNFKTYIGNIKEKYGIFLDFEFTQDSLNITVHKKEHTSMQIDTTLTDVDSSNETYEIKALSKLSVLWYNPTTEEETLKHFYLHSDRTISEVDEDRVDGTVSSLYLSKETEEEILEDVYNEFKSNSYSHLIEADIFTSSKIYPLEELYVGHDVLIKSAAGVKDSIISEVVFSDSSETITVKFGNLKVTLTDKLAK